QQRLRQQLVARLFLELALDAPRRLLLHALAIFGDTHLERVVERRGRQDARLRAQAQQVDAADAPRQARDFGARRLEARAALGEGRARREHRTGELVGEL